MKAREIYIRVRWDRVIVWGLSLVFCFLAWYCFLWGCLWLLERIFS